jgi:hypothetical protein
MDDFISTQIKLKLIKLLSPKNDFAKKLLTIIIFFLSLQFSM